MGRLQRLYADGLALTEDKNFWDSICVEKYWVVYEVTSSAENVSTLIVEDMQETRLLEATGRDVTKKEHNGSETPGAFPWMMDLRKEEACTVGARSSHPSMTKRHFFPLRSMTASATALRTSALGWGMRSSNNAADCMSESARERWMTNSNSWNMFPLAHCWQACQLMVVFPEPATPSRRMLTDLFSCLQNEMMSLRATSLSWPPLWLLIGFSVSLGWTNLVLPSFGHSCFCEEGWNSTV